MSKKTGAVSSFFRKNLYYFIVGAALIVTAVVTMIILASKSTDRGVTGEEFNSTVAEVPEDPSSPESGTDSADEGEGDSTNGESADPTAGNGEDVTPVDKKTVFVMPLKNANVIKDFTSSTVVYNKTLGVYTGHMGVDFAADSGAEVYAAYDGIIESVTTSYLSGTTITIDHGEGLKSVYNSIDAADGIAEGKTVKAGQIIGVVTDNNRQEYKDGPHLHFEVLLNGKKVNPANYLLMSEK